MEGVFSPADMMKLFEKLFIVSKVNQGEYLIWWYYSFSFSFKGQISPTRVALETLLVSLWIRVMCQSHVHGRESCASHMCMDESHVPVTL